MDVSAEVQSISPICNLDSFKKCLPQNGDEVRQMAKMYGKMYQFAQIMGDQQQMNNLRDLLLHIRYLATFHLSPTYLPTPVIEYEYSIMYEQRFPELSRNIRESVWFSDFHEKYLEKAQDIINEEESSEDTDYVESNEVSQDSINYEDFSEEMDCVESNNQDVDRSEHQFEDAFNDDIIETANSTKLADAPLGLNLRLEKSGQLIDINDNDKAEMPILKAAKRDNDLGSEQSTDSSGSAVTGILSTDSSGCERSYHVDVSAVNTLYPTIEPSYNSEAKQLIVSDQVLSENNTEYAQGENINVVKYDFHLDQKSAMCYSAFSGAHIYLRKGSTLIYQNSRNVRKKTVQSRHASRLRELRIEFCNWIVADMAMSQSPT